MYIKLTKLCKIRTFEALVELHGVIQSYTELLHGTWQCFIGMRTCIVG